MLITWSSFSVLDLSLQTFIFIFPFSSSSCCSLCKCLHLYPTIPQKTEILMEKKWRQNISVKDAPVTEQVYLHVSVSLYPAVSLPMPFCLFFENLICLCLGILHLLLQFMYPGQGEKYFSFYILITSNDYVLSVLCSPACGQDGCFHVWVWIWGHCWPDCHFPTLWLSSPDNWPKKR